MSPDLVFQIASTAVLPGWAWLIFAPRDRWRALDRAVRLGLPGALAVLYSVLVLAHFAEAGGGYGSIEQVRALFASDAVLVAGWLHYLAFDLFVAGVVAVRLDRAGVGRITQGFILPTIFLFGPLGLLIALLVEGGLRPRGLLRAEAV